MPRSSLILGLPTMEWGSSQPPDPCQPCSEPLHSVLVHTCLDHFTPSPSSSSASHSPFWARTRLRALSIGFGVPESVQEPRGGGEEGGQGGSALHGPARVHSSLLDSHCFH